MKIKRLSTEILMITLCGVILWYLYQTIVFSKEIIYGISAVLYRIINVVLPSLFGFMVVSDFLVRTNLYQKMSFVFSPVSRLIFKMPSQLFMVFVLSCIGGYPVGIKLLSQIVDNGSIDKETAERMSVVCFMPSPSFTVGIIGLSVYSSEKVGVVIYISCLVSNVFTALILLRKKNLKFKDEVKSVSLSSQKLVDSVTSSGKSMLKMCGVIVFFSYLMIVLECLGFFNIIKESYGSFLFKSVFEITNLSSLTANFRLIPAITAITSFGGISIIIQIIAVNNNFLNLKRFFIARIPIAILSGIVCSVILKLFPLYNQCYTSVYLQKSESKFNFLSLICLFFMIIIIFFQKKNCNSKKSVL